MVLAYDVTTGSAVTASMVTNLVTTSAPGGDRADLHQGRRGGKPIPRPERPVEGRVLGRMDAAQRFGLGQLKLGMMPERQRDRPLQGHTQRRVSDHACRGSIVEIAGLRGANPSGIRQQ